VTSSSQTGGLYNQAVPDLSSPPRTQSTVGNPDTAEEDAPSEVPDWGTQARESTEPKSWRPS